MNNSKLAVDSRTADAIVRTDFASFVRLVFHTLSPSATYHHNWHIDAKCHVLERVRSGQILRLIINVPPRSMKSTICSIAFPAWVLGHDPTKSLICVSYGSDLAIKFGNGSREVMGSLRYKKLFPKTEISRLKNTELEFETTRMGCRLSTSIEGTITGRGGDIVIIDDPLKPNDALSDSRRERVNNAFFNTILSRLNDKRTGAIIIVMQRLHEDDLVGRLLRDAPGEWTVLNLPAIAEQDEKIEVGNGKFHLRRAGDPLHVEREPLSILQSYKAQLGPETFAAQYQQSPTPREGAMIKRAWLRRYENHPQRNSSSMILQSWDTATKDSEHANYSVCSTLLIHEKKYFLLEVFRDRLDYPALKAQAISLAKLHTPKTILIEDAGLGSGLIKELEAKGLPVVGVKPVFNKQTRMSIETGKIASGQFFLPTAASWLEDFENEFVSFPGCRYNDQVDSISQALAHEIPYVWMSDDAVRGYSNLCEALCFQRLFG
jgi:predicted phage terminase large subunit-like protein